MAMPLLLPADLGRDIKAVPRSNKPGERSYDILVDGTPTELKASTGGTTDTVARNPAQGPQASFQRVLDMRRSNVTKTMTTRA